MNKKNEKNIERLKSVKDTQEALDFYKRKLLEKQKIIDLMQKECSHDYILYLGSNQSESFVPIEIKGYYGCALCGETHFEYSELRHAIDMSNYQKERYTLVLESDCQEKLQLIQNILYRILLENPNASQENIVRILLEFSNSYQSKSEGKIRKIY